MKSIRNIKPKRIFEELAEMGVLADLLENQWSSFYKMNDKFREDINEILLKYSEKEVTILEQYYLEELCKSLQFFIDYVSIWKNLKH
ncbi:MAG: hypothetical protein ACUVQ1_03165 [Candidatus Kapaibacteriales bacterium]